MPDIRFIQPALSLLAAATMWYSSAAAAWQDGSDVTVQCIWEKAPHNSDSFTPPGTGFTSLFSVFFW